MTKETIIKLNEEQLDKLIQHQVYTRADIRNAIKEIHIPTVSTFWICFWLIWIGLIITIGISNILTVLGG